MSEATHQPASSASAPRRVLVTGGAGFIGSHLTELLLGRGDHVTIIDDLSTGRRTNLPINHPRMRFIQGELRATISNLDSGERFDEVYHLAAAVGVRLVIDEPIDSIRTNVEGTADLLRFVLERAGNHTPPPTLIASSSEVYGKSEKVPFGEDDDVVYGPTTRTRWSYAASKAIDEHLALAYHAKHGLRAVVARLFNTTGPRQVGNYGMVLPTFVAAALNNDDLPVYGDGQQVRCFCDVRDVVRAMPALLGQPACWGRVFNLGSDRAVSMNQLAELVIATLGSRSRIRHMSYDSVYSPGFEDLRKRVPDLSRIRDAIAFKPTITLEQTIRDLAQQIQGAPALMPGARVVVGAKEPGSVGGPSRHIGGGL